MGASSPGALAAGQEKKGEPAITSLEFEFHLQFPCGFLSTELSDFRQFARWLLQCITKPLKGDRSRRGSGYVRSLKEILNTPTQYDGVWFLYIESIFPFTHNPLQARP